MHFLEWVAGQVQVLLWPNYVDVLPVGDNFANARHILQTEQSELSLQDVFSAAECVLCLPVKCTLPEDGTNEATIIDMLGDIFQNLKLGVSWRTDNNNVGARNDVTWLV